MAAGVVNLASVGVALLAAIPLTLAGLLRHKKTPTYKDLAIWVNAFAGVWTGIELMGLIFTCEKSFPMFKCDTNEIGKLVGQEIPIVIGAVCLFGVSAGEIVSVIKRVWGGIH